MNCLLHCPLQMLKADRERESSQHEEELQRIIESHAKELQDRGMLLQSLPPSLPPSIHSPFPFPPPENANSQKLIAEYEKYQDLQARSQRLQEDYERKLEEKEDEMEKALQRNTEHFEVQLWDKAKQLEQVRVEEIGGDINTTIFAPPGWRRAEAETGGK